MSEYNFDDDDKVEPYVIILERVSNGVVLTDSDKNKTVFEVPDEGNGNYDKADPLIYMLYAVLDALGYGDNKWQREQVTIGVDHGRGYECRDKKCEICKGDIK